MWKPVLASSVLVAALVLACGGRTDGVGNGSSSGASSSGAGSSSGSGSTSSSGGTGSSSGGVTGSSSGGISGSSSGESGSSSGGPSCVFIDPGSYDHSCNAAADCVYITSGEICRGDCASCGSTPINQDGYAKWSATVATIDPATCFCGAPAPLACVSHVCQAQPVELDAGVIETGPPDASGCVFIDLSTFDQSCKVDSDCTEITSGQVCDRNCACGGSAVNVDGLARYQQEVQGAASGPACSCPAFGQPRCIASKCTLCPFGGPNQCPDAG